MEFLSGYIKRFGRKPVTEYPPTQVVEVKPEEYIHHRIRHREDSLLLYQVPENNLFEVVLQRDIPSKGVQTAFSLCRADSLENADASFKSYMDVIPPLSSSAASSALMTTEMLQEICNHLRKFPHQSLAHVAAHFGILDCFKNQQVAFEAVNLVCPDTHFTPLHLAIKSGKILTVATIVSLNPKYDLVDINGNNVLHMAAPTSKDIISLICSSIISSSNVPPSTDGTASPTLQSPTRDDTILIKLINARNNEGVSPIHLACLSDKPECVKELLKNGADVNGACIEKQLRSSGQESFPNALGSSSGEAASPESNFDKLMIDHLDPKDMKNGGNPLHWAKSPQCMEPLIEMGCDINAKNFQGETVLHVMVARNKLPCVITLLSYGADVNAKGPNGSTPLHLAVRGNDVTVVQALVVFGAKLSLENVSNESPRHLAATAKRNATQDTILYVLHSVGAKRCTRSSAGSPCTDGCSTTGVFNGTPPSASPFHRIKSLYDPLLGRSIVKASCKKKRRSLFTPRAASPNNVTSDSPSKIARKTSSTDVMETDSPDLTEDEDANKTCRVLSLDGGGIRGLVLIQMLSVLEDMMQPTPIHSAFDWIAGTSTGGILALVLASGHSANECRQFYFRMKNKVFVGVRPYESEPLDAFLRKTLGEETRMADIVKPKVTLTATVGDKFPADLHLFRNYKSPDEILGYTASNQQAKWAMPHQSSEDVLLWTAARSSGAAPTYFRPCGKYLDGGLISNNPTLDILTEITQINAALDATHQSNEKTTPSVVVSLGTGAPPVTDVPIIDVFRPDSLYGVAKIALMASSLGQLLIDQASQSDGQVVERAKAWCHQISLPFFRLNPPLSENIPMDETHNVKLINMLWETTVYMKSRKEEFEELVLLLK